MTEDDQTMDRAELERIGALLFGLTWKTDIPDHFDVRRTTLGRWLRDDIVPPWAAKRLRAMVRFPPPPRTGEAYAVGSAAVFSRLTAVLEAATASGWDPDDVLEMVADWMDRQDGFSEAQGTPIVESDPPVVASGPIAP